MTKEVSILEYHTFRRNIRLLRHEKGFTANEAAKEVGLRHCKRYADLEEGRMPPHVEEIIKISEYYKVKIDTLIYKTSTIQFI